MLRCMLIYSRVFAEILFIFNVTSPVEAQLIHSTPVPVFCDIEFQISDDNSENRERIRSIISRSLRQMDSVIIPKMQSHEDFYRTLAMHWSSRIKFPWVARDFHYDNSDNYLLLGNAYLHSYIRSRGTHHEIGALDHAEAIRLAFLLVLNLRRQLAPLLRSPAWYGERLFEDIEIDYREIAFEIEFPGNELSPEREMDDFLQSVRRGLRELGLPGGSNYLSVLMLNYWRQNPRVASQLNNYLLNFSPRRESVLQRGVRSALRVLMARGLSHRGGSFLLDLLQMRAELLLWQSRI